MTGLVLSEKMFVFHIAIIICILYGLGQTTAEDTSCCMKKMVGDKTYNFMHREDTEKHECISNCVYEDEEKPGNLFCFKNGNLGVTCLEHSVTGNYDCLNCNIKDGNQCVPDCFPDPTKAECISCLALAAPLAGCFEPCGLTEEESKIDLLNRCEARPDPSGVCVTSQNRCDGEHAPAPSKYLFGRCLCTCRKKSSK